MDKLTAAPIIRQNMDIIGAPGKTDFIKIYIASELNKSEYRTVLRHEQSHVWAAHNRRTPENVDLHKWKIACEMEIARNIYDDEDIENIKAPRSRLNGGYIPESIDGLPNDISLAEDIYNWLIENNYDNESDNHKSCNCSFDNNDNDDDNNHNDDKNLIDLIKDIRSELDENEILNINQNTIIDHYKFLKNRPPSLTNEIDAALRIRVERSSSYRRPSRRIYEDNIILSGSISIPMPPLVEIFVDRSGSFTVDKTIDAEKKLKLLLSKYGASIRCDVWYFGGDKLVDVDPGGGGNTPYVLILKHLKLSNPKLAIIITDDDPVHSDAFIPNRNIKILCIPIGCDKTKLASSIGGIDVILK